MTRKQVAFIIVVNAVISAAISVVITLLLPRVVLPPTLISPEVKSPSIELTSSGAMATQAVLATTPTPEQVIHVVQPGDTISGLALQYDVSGEDIIAANRLENPNFLQVGAELIIPVGGLLEATATFTPAPTPTDTPIPFEPPSADMTATAAAELGLTTSAGATTTPLPTSLPLTGELQVEITEVLGTGLVDQERVVISNLGDRLADMQGWTLTDADGNVYVFSNFRLWPGGNVTVHTRIGQDGNPPANFYWGKLEALWSVGEVLVLKDADGMTLSTFAVGP
jgi:LysM repeat protein